MYLKGPAQQLADFMIKMSLKYYNEEWTFGLEFELWKEISGGQEMLSDEEVNRLKELAKWCNGWVLMSLGGGTENLTFMLLDDWRDKYQNENPF